jgi:hypothetical protein
LFGPLPDQGVWALCKTSQTRDGVGGLSSPASSPPIRWLVVHPLQLQSQSVLHAGPVTRPHQQEGELVGGGGQQNSVCAAARLDCSQQACQKLEETTYCSRTALCASDNIYCSRTALCASSSRAYLLCTFDCSLKHQSEGDCPGLKYIRKRLLSFLNIHHAGSVSSAQDTCILPRLSQIHYSAVMLATHVAQAVPSLSMFWVIWKFGVESAST